MDDYKKNNSEVSNPFHSVKGEGDYYKEILKRLLIPSLPALLLSFSTITLSYACILSSISEYIIGTVFLLLACITFLNIFKNNSYRNKGSHNSTYGCTDKGNIEPTLPCQDETRRTRIKAGHILLPIFISLLISFRVFSITGDALIDFNGKGIVAEISDVKQLRYNQQITLILHKNRDEIHSNSAAVRSIAYSPKDMGINRNDTIEILSKPQVLKADSSTNSTFKRNLIRKGFRYIFYLNNKNHRLIKKGSQNIKTGIRKKIERNISQLFNKKTASLLKALYFGNKNFIKKSIVQEFKRAGVLHVLAASGLHIGIVASIPFLLLGLVRLNKNAILLIITTVLFFYLYITDTPVSLFRAFMMFFIYFIQSFFDFDKNIFNTLFLSALIILLIYPYELYNPGFQLSFGATLGIILLFNIYRNTFLFLPSFISNSIAITLSAQVFVFPIIWFHMKEVNLNGIISNLVVVPGMAAVLITSIITNIIFLISSEVAKFSAIITDHIFHYIHRFVKLISETEGHFTVYDNPYILIIPYLLIIIPVLPFLNKRRIVSVSTLAAYILAWFFLTGDQRNYKNQIAIFKRLKTDIILCRKGKTADIIGNINSFEDAKEINNYIIAGNIYALNVYIPEIDYKNVKYFSYIIKRANVSTCNIPSNFKFAPYLKEFFRIMDIDEIRLKIREFPTNRVPQKNYNKQLLKVINETDKEQSDNLFKLYNLLKGKGPEKLFHVIYEDKPISSHVIFI